MNVCAWGLRCDVMSIRFLFDNQYNMYPFTDGYYVLYGTIRPLRITVVYQKCAPPPLLPHPLAIYV